MDAMQMVLPVLGIAAAAAVTFYAVSFSEIRERSFADLEDSEGENRGGGFQSTASSRQTRARRKAEREARKREP